MTDSYTLPEICSKCGAKDQWDGPSFRENYRIGTTRGYPVYQNVLLFRCFCCGYEIHRPTMDKSDVAHQRHP